MYTVYNRVAAWNAQRYEQVYDHNLAVALLSEEFKEWLEAENKVDKLDALCDISYVAMGVLWKLDAPEEVSTANGLHSLKVMDYLTEMNELNPAYFIGTFLAVFEHDKEYPPIQMMHHIIAASMAQMIGMGLTFKQTIQALTIVCNANDTKAVQKVDSSVKANIDKGSNFVPPEAGLTKLLELVQCL